MPTIKILKNADVNLIRQHKLKVYGKYRDLGLLI